MHFFPQKKLTTSFSFFSCRLQNTGRQRRFTVKIKQIKRSDMVTFFLFSVDTITEAKQYAGLGRAEAGLEPGRWIFQLGHMTCSAATEHHMTEQRYSGTTWACCSYCSGSAGSSNWSVKRNRVKETVASLGRLVMSRYPSVSPFI